MRLRRRSRVRLDARLVLPGTLSGFQTSRDETPAAKPPASRRGLRSALAGGASERETVPPLRRVTHDAAEPEMARGGVDGLGHARRRPVTLAVVGCAEERASL